MVQTYQRQELPPGVTGQVKPGYELADRSGEQQFAGILVGTAVDLWKQAIATQASLEYTDFIGKVKTAEAEFERYITKNPNELPEIYTEQQNKMMADIQKAGGTAKTNVARQRIRQFYNDNENLIREQTSTMAVSIVRKHQLDIYNAKLKAAVGAGDVETVNTIHSEWDKELIGEDELASITWKEDLKKAFYQKAQNDISPNAQTAQAFLDMNEKQVLAKYPGLDSAEIRALHYYAETVKLHSENQFEELTNQQIQAIHQLAIKSLRPKKEGEVQITPEYVKAKIDQSDALTPIQQTEAWKVYNEALSVRAKTGQNPYDTTQDWNAAMEAYWKAEQGIAPDRKDVGSKYDVQWYEKLKKIAEGGGTAADFENSKAAKNLAAMVDDFKKTMERSETFAVVLKEKGYRLLQDAISSSEKPLTDREKKQKALEIFNNLKTEYTAGKFEKLTPESMMTPAELEVGKQEFYSKQRQYQPTREEFRKRVAQLKAQGQERAARKYYDQWKKILWPD